MNLLLVGIARSNDVMHLITDNMPMVAIRVLCDAPLGVAH